MNLPITLLLATQILLILTPVLPARADGPSSMPTLCIEPGMHTAPIWGIDVDHSGRYLVSASLDKTAIIWDLRLDVPVQVLRPPIADGDDGAFFTSVFSPDGTTVACAGITGLTWDGTNCIYLFDRATGAIKRRILGLSGANIGMVAYSPDAHYLAELSNLPAEIKRHVGYALRFVQNGTRPTSVKTFIGTIQEIRVWGTDSDYRVYYVANLESHVYLLHAMIKRSTSGVAIPQKDRDLILKRHAEAQEHNKRELARKKGPRQ